MILPMNAKACTTEKIAELFIDSSYVLETKIDGYRAIWEDGQFHSRLGNIFEIPELSRCLDSKVILDGEIYVPGGNSSDVTIAMGKDGDKSKLRYVVFDRLDEGLVHETWEDRRHSLEQWGEEYIKTGMPIELSTVYADKHDLHTITDIMGYIESHNIEGFMLKNIEEGYKPNKRPVNNWWKIKKHMTYDVVVTGFVQGKGKFEGLIGSLEFALYKGNELVKCGQCSGFSDEIRTLISQNKNNYIGAVMEIAAMERTKDGAFRHPVFKQWRSDKLPAQCSWKQ